MLVHNDLELSIFHQLFREAPNWESVILRFKETETYKNGIYDDTNLPGY